MWLTGGIASESVVERVVALRYCPFSIQSNVKGLLIRGCSA